MSETTAIKLDAKIKRRLKNLSNMRERSPHWLMRDAIVQYLDREENYQRERTEDQERWDEYVMTGEALPHAKVMAWLDDVSKGALQKKKKRR